MIGAVLCVEPDPSLLAVLVDEPNPDSASASATVPSPWSSAYRRMTLGLLITITAGAFEAMAVATVLPKTVDELGGLHLYGWLFSAFTLANMVGIVIAGGEIDHSGPWRPFAAGIALFTIGLLIGGAAPTMAVLILGRVVQGFGSGMLGSVAYAVIRIVYPEQVRPRLLALWASAWVVPGLVGPAIAGIVAETAGWRWVFFGIVPFAAAAVVLTANPLRRIPDRQGKPRDPAHVRDALLLALGVSAFLAGVGRDQVVIAAALGVAGLAIALPPFRRLAPPGTLRAKPGPAAGVVCILLLNIGFFGAEAFIPLALTDLRDRSATFAGLPLTAAALTWTAGAWLLDRFATRIPRVLMVRTGMLVVAAGVGIFLLVLRPETPVSVSFLSWAVAGLGMGLAFSTLQLIVLDSAPEGQEGIATAGMQLANSLGIAFSAGIGGAIVAAFSSGDQATARGILIQSVAMASALFLGWLIAARLPEKRPATN